VCHHVGGLIRWRGGSLGGRDSSRVPHRGRDGDDWLVVSRRRGKAQGQASNGRDRKQGNWQQGDWYDYGNKQSRFRVTADLWNGDRYRKNRGAVQSNTRPPHVMQVRRRGAFDGDLNRPRDDGEAVKVV